MDSAWDLEMELLCLPATGGSVRQMQKLADRIAKACGGVPAHVRELAALPNNSHRERDLHRWVHKQSWREVLPEVYSFGLPYTEDGLNEQSVEHCAFLPHELMSSLSNFPELFEMLLTGPAGTLESFWQNVAETAWYQQHPVPTLHDSPARCIPIGLHGDDAGVFANEKVLVLTWGSVARELLTLDSRLLFTAVTYAHCVPGKTVETLYAVLAWSVNCMIAGVFPTHDHEGVPFSTTHHPARFAVAGRPLTKGHHLGIWSELRGDWKWQAEVLEFDAHYGKTFAVICAGPTRKSNGCILHSSGGTPTFERHGARGQRSAKAMAGTGPT